MYSLFKIFVFTTSLSPLKSTGAVSNLPIPNSSALLFKVFKPLGTFFDLSMSSLSIFDFNLDNSAFSASFALSTPVAFLRQILLHN